MSQHYLVYVRRSYKRQSDAEVSDELQAARAIALLPSGATHEVIADSGGHRSGRTANRPGWQHLIARIAQGGIAGVAVYDLSRLSRNARLLLDLKAALDKADVPLLVASMPGTRWSTAEGRFLLTILAGAAQLQADIDAKRMTDVMRSVFEAGGHRGLDPFGYRSVWVDNRRTLEVVEDEAVVVRLVFGLLASRSTQDVARILNRDGIQHRADRPWTHSAVKDLWRRGRVYLGLAVTRRGREERPGRHPAIITEAQWNAAAAAMQRRQRIGRPTRQHRTYILSGLIRCDCGRTMAGTARTARGQEWRYYRCRQCAVSVRAETVEDRIVEAIAGMRQPDELVAYLRAELRDRTKLPLDDSARKRLEQRRARLVELYGWGDIDEARYRAERARVDADLAALPTEDRVVLFDRNRILFASMAEAIPNATPAQLKEAVGRIVAWAQRDGTFDWTGPAAPFFAPALVSKPPGGLEPTVAPQLAWYIAA